MQQVGRVRLALTASQVQPVPMARRAYRVHKDDKESRGQWAKEVFRVRRVQKDLKVHRVPRAYKVALGKPVSKASAVLKVRLVHKVSLGLRVRLAPLVKWGRRAKEVLREMSGFRVL